MPPPGSTGVNPDDVFFQTDTKLIFVAVQVGIDSSGAPICTFVPASQSVSQGPAGPAGPQGPAGPSSGGAVQTVTVYLSPAQLAEIDTVPVTLLPSPGPGKAIVPLAFAGKMSAGPNSFPYASQNQGSIAVDWESDILVGSFPQASYGFGENQFGSAPPILQVAGALLFQAAVQVNPDSQVENEAVIAKANYPVADAGQLLESSLYAGGSGYAPGDTGTVFIGYIGSITYEVLTVDENGGVLTYSITSPGNGAFATTSPVGTLGGGPQPGSGSEFTISVLSFQTGDGTMEISMSYIVVDL